MINHLQTPLQTKMKFITALVSFAAAIKLREEGEDIIAGLQADCAAGRLSPQDCEELAYCLENMDDPACVAAAEELGLGGEGEGPEDGEGTPAEEGEGSGPEEGENDVE